GGDRGGQGRREGGSHSPARKGRVWGQDEDQTNQGQEGRQVHEEEDQEERGEISGPENASLRVPAGNRQAVAVALLRAPRLSGARRPARGGQCGAPAHPAHLVPPRDEARRAERDADGGARDQDQNGGPSGRCRNRAHGGLPRGARAAAYAARRRGLRDLDRQDDLRDDRRQGVDLQRRAHRGSARSHVFDGRLRGAMLAPKRVKFRKRFKGRTKGMATRGNTVAFGHYGLMALEPGWISNRQIEASRVALTREMKRGGKVWIRLFPDKPITKKPAETRMGKGKGNPEGWVAVVKPGRVMFEVEGIAEHLAREALELAAAKLPVKSKFVKREER